MTLQQKQSIFGTIDFRLSDGHCIADAGVGKDWLTVYLLKTDDGHENQGEASKLMTALKEYCDSTKRTMRVWCPMSKKVVHICEKLGLETTTLDDALSLAEKELA